MTKKELSIGKYRGIQQISTPEGAFTMLALDHQESFRKGINSADPMSVSYQEIVERKLDIISLIANQSSALLTDLRYGVAQSIASGALQGKTGLIVTIEQSPGYGAGETTARRTVLVKGWNAFKVRKIGASAVKLLVYYHPESKTAKDQEALVAQVADDCKINDIPLVLEVLTHPIVEGQSKESAAFAEQRPHIIIESAKRLCPLGADVFKAEFPADVKYEHNEGKMLAWCQQLTEAAAIPWVVLSAAVDHEAFCRQVEISCDGGASGFLAGRSIWKEALALPAAERKQFLQTTATKRLQELTSITLKKAHPFTEWYQSTVTEGWFERYS